MSCQNRDNLSARGSLVEISKESSDYEQRVWKNNFYMDVAG